MSTVIRGDTSIWSIPVVDKDGQPWDFTNCTAWVTVKANASVPDDEATYQHYLRVDATGVVIGSDGMWLGPDGVAGGLIIQRLSPEESRLLETGAYVYDVQVRAPSPDIPGEYDIHTPVNGSSETVVADITHAIALGVGTP